MNSFALIGAAGYIAPRHLRAIRDVGGELKVAFDPSDSVGVIDGYFPDANFFVEFERFDRHLDKLRRRGDGVDWVAICSPNYLHDAHCRFALRSGADAICEKPLVLNPWNIDGLAEIERETGRKISTILQLRLHPAIKELRRRIEASKKNIFDVDLTYIAPRGRWYQTSWKGDVVKSGGVATNIGVHFFDMLSYVFGPVQRSLAHVRDAWRAAGYLQCDRANIRWFLSVEGKDLPGDALESRTTYRAITIDGENLEFSEGFGDLHTQSYREILAGRGFGTEDVRSSVEIVSAFRTAPLTPELGECHPFVR